ncbi:Carbohydrate binding domain protein [Anaerohalosphaera lusitana]|uniref:Carbohydrate binding domain protein n=2 Tax=Anaerohalosphaera lusitana TaxID=1936003 RepID=A0A1U9NJ36_9BACT|nr:Carbohydrate binding domain protein [Anaerohalosphaera lusitana]
MRLVICLLSLCLVVSAAQAEEVLVNGGFETPDSDWTITGTDGQWRTDNVHQGTYSIVLGKSNNDGSAYQTTAHNIVAGNTYTIDFYMTISTAGRPLTAQLYYEDAGVQTDIPGWSVSISSTDTSNGTWDQGTGEFVAAAGADYVGKPIGVRFHGAWNWTFLDTVSLTSEVTTTEVPSIVTQPADQSVLLGDPAEFTVDAVNSATGDSTGLTYQWKKVLDGTNDPNVATTQALSFPSVALTDEGSYYCVVTAPGGTVTSETAALTVQRLVAHWTMDQADFVDGAYIDVSGNGNDALVGGTIDSSVFVPGANGDPAGAVSIVSDPNAYATAGTFDPGTTPTISAWVNLDAGVTTDTCITAKDGTTGWDNARWDFVVQPTDDAIWINTSPSNIGTGSLLDLDPAGQWQHFVITYEADETVTIYKNGVAELVYTRTVGPDTDGVVSIGARDDGSIPLGGILDDVRIYNYPLTASDVAQLYVNEVGGEVCALAPVMDFNDDCEVNIADFAIFAAQWLDSGIISAN